MVVVYSSHYDITFFGVERLHPFDPHRASRAWRHIRRTHGSALLKKSLRVDRPASLGELRLVHSQSYIDSLGKSANVAAALELPFLQRAPAWLLNWRILRPMRWAARGTVLAMREAVRNGLAMNIAGGFHHANRDSGEGFCVYSDVALAVAQLREKGVIASGQRIIYVDLDAHQGNGVCHQFRQDKEVFIFDAYNESIYPGHDLAAQERIDCDMPLEQGCDGTEYLEKLQAKLPGFIESAAGRNHSAIGVYNAGTDVFAGDPLGGLKLSSDDILARDLFVVRQFRSRGIPLVILPSGGYTKESFRFIADTAAALMNADQLK